MTELVGLLASVLKFRSDQGQHSDLPCLRLPSILSYEGIMSKLHYVMCLERKEGTGRMLHSFLFFNSMGHSCLEGLHGVPRAISDEAMAWQPPAATSQCLENSVDRCMVTFMKVLSSD
mmetsp:Transcript_128764/g.411738  ORF Transcript_128764/g.411738 Transcript_128764/m.411738 type:complete len:118 (-) Transcript_128764:145-498(-)